jgi:hypothetical protein
MKQAPDPSTSPREIITVVGRAVALGAGVAVVVLQVLGNLTPETGFTLLGLGLAALALAALQ